MFVKEVEKLMLFTVLEYSWCQSISHYLYPIIAIWKISLYAPLYLRPLSSEAGLYIVCLRLTFIIKYFKETEFLNQMIHITLRHLHRIVQLNINQLSYMQGKPTAGSALVWPVCREAYHLACVYKIPSGVWLAGQFEHVLSV